MRTPPVYQRSPRQKLQYWLGNTLLFKPGSIGYRLQVRLSTALMTKQEKNRLLASVDPVVQSMIHTLDLVERYKKHSTIYEEWFSQQKLIQTCPNGNAITGKMAFRYLSDYFPYTCQMDAFFQEFIPDNECFSAMVTALLSLAKKLQEWGYFDYSKESVEEASNLKDGDEPIIKQRVMGLLAEHLAKTASFRGQYDSVNKRLQEIVYFEPTLHISV